MVVDDADDINRHIQPHAHFHTLTHCNTNSGVDLEQTVPTARAHGLASRVDAQTADTVFVVL